MTANEFSQLAENISISIVGLGYVGLPLAVAFVENGFNVIGFDLNKEKIDQYKNGIDVTDEIGSERFKITSSKIHFTSHEKELENSSFIIIAVPTPVGKAHVPDLTAIEKASAIVGRNIKKGAVIVYESTVYPGVTEDVCVPILEKESGLKCVQDFKVGYSPERINPGDKVHRVENIVKIVSGIDDTALQIISDVYGSIIKAGIHKASSIRVAEAAKVIENAQRDVNIAFMNELSIIFNMMGIDTKEVLAAAGTKWNFLKFEPGLVGGHCIGVDPYYLTYKSEEAGYISQLILAARRINDQMGMFVAQKTIKEIIKAHIDISQSKVLVLGVTFKENCQDIRNSKVIDIINEMKEYGIEVLIADPYAKEGEVKREYGLNLTDINEIKNVDAVIMAVAHGQYKNINIAFLKKMYRSENRILIDVKGVLNKKELEQDFKYWRL